MTNTRIINNGRKMCSNINNNYITNIRKHNNEERKLKV